MRTHLAILSIVALGLLSCRKIENTAPEGQAHTVTREFVATLEGETKTSLHGENKVQWSAGDTIKYYTRDNGPVRTFIVPADCAAVTIPVELGRDDRYIVAIHGSGTLSKTHSASETAFRNAMTCIQDGGFGESHTAEAYTDDLESGRLVFHNSTAMLKFSLERDDIGYMILSSPGAGIGTFSQIDSSRMLLFPGKGGARLDGILSDRIHIDMREDKTYFIALPPAELEGFAIDIYDTAGKNIGKVESKRKIMLERNDLVDLGTIDGRIVPNQAEDRSRVDRNTLFEKANKLSRPQLFIENEYIYESSDYSQDGSVIQLQKAAKGNGIDIVIIGEGYTDRLIEDGTYRKDAEFMADSFFDIEPYKTFRELFNVYCINAVSKDETYIPELNTETTFSYKDRQNGSSPTINLNKILLYTQHAINNEKNDEATIIIPVNLHTKRGSCAYLLESLNLTDYASGTSICIITKGIDYYSKGVIIHESSGHGFAKLADEYIEHAIRVPEYYNEWLPTRHKIGKYINIDIQANPYAIHWSRFLRDDRYKNEVGIFEGALYQYGIYRPSEGGIMNSTSELYFNAPSRELIYYRIHKLAYGDDWQYDFEDFADYDEINRESIKLNTSPAHIPLLIIDPDHQSPILLDITWKDLPAVDDNC